jgi:hypothetical protein
MKNIINKKIMDNTLSNTIGMVIVKKRKIKCIHDLVCGIHNGSGFGKSTRQLSIFIFFRFFAPARYRVVKIAHSSPKVVLQTMKYIVKYPSSGPLLRGNSPTSSGLILKMNRCYKWVSRELQKFTW